MALLPLVPLTIQSHIPLAACSLQAQHHPGWQQRQSTALVLLANAAKELMKWIECNDTHGPRWVGSSFFFFFHREFLSITPPSWDRVWRTCTWSLNTEGRHALDADRVRDVTRKPAVHWTQPLLIKGIRAPWEILIVLATPLTWKYNSNVK